MASTTSTSTRSNASPRQRKKTKPQQSSSRVTRSTHQQSSLLDTVEESGSEQAQFDPIETNRLPKLPLANLLWPARHLQSPWEVLPLILMAVGLFRWTTGLWGYSGFDTPPMHGDYEAQRHWMEITTQLPISQWYFHDLEWWGLDYPPLTAYHSWLMGKIGGYINPSWFALHVSRGLDDPTMKVFMRATVIVSEYLIFIPATVIFVRRLSKLQKVKTWNASLALTAILMQPGLILIDHGHFQYNTVMLGFAMATMSSILAGRLMWSCVFFVSALGFKQMALYYAPVMFAYLLGTCFSPKINVPRFLGIAVVTAASFGLLLLPLVFGALYDTHRGIDPQAFVAPLPIFTALGSKLNTKAWYYPIVQQLTQLLFRVFPFARGLFEDKVANFWCALNVVLKLRKFPADLLQKASLLATVASFTPPCLIIFCKPQRTLVPLALATCAWGFFLFSFQVHEKSVLLPLMPMTTLLAGRQGLSDRIRTWVGFANILGVWTMFPLLERDELRVPYWVVTLLWSYMMGLPPTNLSAYGSSDNGPHVGHITTAIHAVFYLTMALWHPLQAFVAPPETLPDLWVVINAMIGAAGFGICYLWCLFNLVVEGRVEIPFGSKVARINPVAWKQRSTTGREKKKSMSP